MIVVWSVLGLWAVALIVRGLRRRPPATYKPMPPVTDTVAGLSDRTRGQRLTASPYDWDSDPKDAA